MSTISKYLSQYAEPEIQSLSTFNVPKPFAHCLVIPAYNENSDFVNRLSTSPIAVDTLLILVVNQPDSDPDKIENIQFVNTISCSSEFLWNNKNLNLLQMNALTILLVDRFSRMPIGKSEGVGKARKIGCDLAVQLFQCGKLKSPWIYSTDADTDLPENYFSVIDVPTSTSAMVFDFAHRSDQSQMGRATLAYERAIKYYRRGLSWAGSPYAFYTLGSTIAIHNAYYSHVRGFPCRAAGEDFYLLNKLAKVGLIQLRPDITLSIENRLSQRVPFGTGPAVKKIMDTWQADKRYCYYNPKVFLMLKSWLAAQNRLCEDFFQNKLNFSNVLDQSVCSAIGSINIEQFLEHAKKQCKDKKSYMKQFHFWFDGFRTLKFIHHLRNLYFNDIPVEECLHYANHHFDE